MKNFIHPDFLLEGETAREIYHEFAENQPIIDFHCHLSPQLIAEDHNFDNLGQVWLEGDHYKWRAMRTNGVDEEFCTGSPDFYQKFIKWAETVPHTVGNPLYHWTHLELARYFNIFDLLNPKTADTIYHDASEMLRHKDFSIKSILNKMNVEVIGTTDDPADSLKHHASLKDFHVKVRPTWRPDNLIKTDDPTVFNSYIQKLEKAAGKSINSYADLLSVLDERHAYFDKMGCRASDHGLDRMYWTDDAGIDPEKAFKKLRVGKKLTETETEGYRFALMQELCKLNHKRGWVQQFHLGAMRNNNTRLFKKLGPDTGFDSIGQPQDSFKLSRFLDSLDTNNQLTKTILYNLNPADNETFVTMIGNFQDGSVPGKMQYGAAWWFLDQKVGMEKHLNDLSVLGLLSRFVGMVTDSRSFLSFPRHEYFRRIACNHIGKEVDKGVIPNDKEILKNLVEGISYKNAKEYFGF
ncbi:glucuronate isomerase [Marinilabilia salmonicolor]|uniref:glucuronate isomerase n=1 Tax=Marinilabilia salmonicolor TaxID=989 RepID=UPI00029A65C5|nr:glucuronate isomerase [Marinilabilia salmonicolor]